MRPIERRDFLRAGGLVLLGAAAACGGGGKTAPRATGAVSSNTIDELIAGRTQNLAANLALGEVLSGIPQRIPFALTPPNEPTTFLRGGSGRVWVAESRTAPALGPFPLEFHDEGLRDAKEGTKGIYSVRLEIPRDGLWVGLAEVTPEGAGAPLLGGFNKGVGRQYKQPVPGGKAPKAPSPTKDDHRGVEPYCTRQDPETKRRVPCAMHAVSLDEALAGGKPAVVIIATPAFCQTRFCGPEVDVVQAASMELGTKMNFIHIEVYKDDTDAPATGLLAPAAKAFRLEEEPAIYFIGSDGVISDRFLGPAAVDEVRAAAKALS